MVTERQYFVVGYGVSRSEIPNIVKSLKAEKDGHIKPGDKKFSANRPSKTWVVRFLERHGVSTCVRYRGRHVQIVWWPKDSLERRTLY